MSLNPVRPDCSNSGSIEEIKSSATGMVKNYGDLALERAHCEIRRMEETGSEEGVRRWCAIAEAIEQMIGPPH